MSGAWDYNVLEPEEEALFNHKVPLAQYILLWQKYRQNKSKMRLLVAVANANMLHN